MDANKQQEQRAATASAADATQTTAFVVELSAGASPLHVLCARICDMSLFKASALYRLGNLAALDPPTSALCSFQMLLCNMLRTFPNKDQQLEAFRRLFPNVTFTSRHPLQGVSPALYTLTDTTTGTSAQAAPSTAEPATSPQTSAGAACDSSFRGASEKESRRSDKDQQQQQTPSPSLAKQRMATSREQTATSALLQLSKSLPAHGIANTMLLKARRRDHAVSAPPRRHHKSSRRTRMLKRSHVLGQVNSEGATSPLSDASRSASTSPKHDGSLKPQ